MQLLACPCITMYTPGNYPLERILEYILESCGFTTAMAASSSLTEHGSITETGQNSSGFDLNLGPTGNVSRHHSASRYVQTLMPSFGKFAAFPRLKPSRASKGVIFVQELLIHALQLTLSGLPSFSIGQILSNHINCLI